MLDLNLALELYELCGAEHPAIQRAEELIRSGQIDLSAVAEGTSECFLTRAIDAFNYRIAELLLENGADPNVSADEYGFALWLATRFDSLAQEDEKADQTAHLKLARLLLEKGADPSGLEGSEEAVLDYVLWRMFNDHDMNDADYAYAAKALILMIAYGASTEYCSPRILKSFHKEKLGQYSFRQLLRKDGIHRYGIITDEEGETVAYV